MTISLNLNLNGPTSSSGLIQQCRTNSGNNSIIAGWLTITTTYSSTRMPWIPGWDFFWWIELLIFTFIVLSKTSNILTVNWFAIYLQLLEFLIFCSSFVVYLSPNILQIKSLSFTYIMQSFLKFFIFVNKFNCNISPALINDML